MKSAFSPIAASLLIGVSIPAISAPSNHCRWVDGRLVAYNGTPTFRIWPRGTKRLLGVVDRSGASESADVLPAKVSNMKPSFSRELWGSFRMCAQTPERAGWMRMVTVIDAKGLTARER